jgi:hypothetical protein
MSFNAAKVAPRTSSGVAFVDADVHVALRFHLERESDFFVHLGVLPPAAEECGER